MTLKPFPIPDTSPQCYISFKHALNLREEHEDTGEWHFLSAFFCCKDQNFDDFRPIPRAGKGQTLNTNLSLGNYGVREMSEILERQGIKPATEPVYVANHYRAITDLAMLHLNKGKMPSIANNYAINQWLDTEQQVNTLIQNYLLLLHNQLDGDPLNTYQKWIKTVFYE